jgi:hypothetical protein
MWPYTQQCAIVDGAAGAHLLTINSSKQALVLAELAASTVLIGHVDGPDAENAAITGNPLLGGGRYDSTARALDNGDVGAIALNPYGAQITNLGGDPGATPATNTIADASTKTTIVAAPGASIALAVTTLSIWQTASPGAEATVSVYDGLTVIAEFPVGTEFGSGVDKDYTVPLMLSANSLLALQSDVAAAIAWNVQTLNVGV